MVELEENQDLKIDYQMKEQIEKLIRYSFTEMEKQKFLSISDISCPVRDTTGSQVDLVYYRIIRLIALRESLGSVLSANLLYQAGHRIGREADCSSLDQLQNFLDDFLLGKIKIVEQKTNFIVVEEDECATCSGLPNIGEAVCDFEAGFIAGCLERMVGKKVIVKETKCWGLGDKICRFEASILPGEVEEQLEPTGDPIEMIATLTGKAAKAIDLARKLEQINNKYREDLEMARTVQLSLLPNKLPRLPGLEISTRYMSANQIGGDFYDIFILPEDKVGFIVADVAGHGTASALLTASMKAIIGRLEHLYQTPAQFLSELNQQLYPLLNKNDTVNFVTAVYCVVDPVNNTILIADAGHPYPLMVKASGAILRLGERNGGIPLGITSRFKYNEERFLLDKKDLILIYTDGLIECLDKNNEQLGEERILKLIVENRSLLPEQLNDLLIDALNQHLQSGTVTDDINTIFLRIS